MHAGRIDATFAVFCAIAIPTLIWILLPGVGSRPVGPQSQCRNNLQQIGLALGNYRDEFKCFPPAYVADADGKPMHSWRVLILPYLDRQDLYDAYNFNDPWDHAANVTVRHCAVKVYMCPTVDAKTRSASYLAVVGPNTIWPGTACRKLVDVNDTRSQTLMLLEVPDSKIFWSEPQDLTLVDLKGERFDKLKKQLAPHRAGFNALFVDGAVGVLQSDIASQTLLKMSTMAGGEE